MNIKKNVFLNILITLLLSCTNTMQLNHQYSFNILVDVTFKFEFIIGSILNLVKHFINYILPMLLISIMMYTWTADLLSVQH